MMSRRLLLRHVPRTFCCGGKVKRGFSTIEKPENHDPGAYCVDLVKRFDFENYIIGLLFPVAARRSYFAIRAFNVETALIKDNTRGNVLTGQLRMQWWRDVVSDIYKGKIPKHPMAMALATAINEHKLTKRFLDRIIDARFRDLDAMQPQQLSELEEYAEWTASSMNYLVLETLGVRNDDADHAASHIGKAVGIVTLLRGTKFHIAQNQLYLPTELLRQYHVSVNDVLKGTSSPEQSQRLADVVYEVASHAFVHLEHARNFQNTIPPESHLAFLPAVRASIFLNKLQKAHFDLFDEHLQKNSQFEFQLRLLWAYLRKRI